MISPKLLILFYVFIKSLIWMLVGIIFGAITFILVFASKVLYDKPINVHTLITYDYIMFLCVTLMAGAAADFVNSPKRVWGNRLSPLFVCIILLLVLCFVFHPMVNIKPDGSILKWLTITYSIIAFLFCTAIKSTLFYEECEQLPRLKF